MATIHPLASVDPGAQLGEDVEVGPFAVIENGAVIGDRCKIGPDVYITRWVRLGNDVRISKGAVLGTDPQDLKFAGEETTLEVGDRTVIREYATLNRGTEESWKTVVGSDCMLMSYSHVAHDCQIGNHVIMSNAVNLAGHVHIEDWVILSGMVPVHQFDSNWKTCLHRRGDEGTYRCSSFCQVGGRTAILLKGLTLLGLQRRGFTKEQLQLIHRVYKIVYRSKLNRAQAIERIRGEMEVTDVVEDIVEFIESRKDRGLLLFGAHK